MSDDDSLDRQIAKIYYIASDPASYSGVERLHPRARELGVAGDGLTRERVQTFLRGEQAYTLHRRNRKHSARNRTYVGRIE